MTNIQSLMYTSTNATTINNKQHDMTSSVLPLACEDPTVTHKKTSRQSFWLAVIDIICWYRRHIFTAGIDYRRKHISNTRTMCWEYNTPAVWLQATLCRQQRVAQPLQPFAVTKICQQTYIDRSGQNYWEQWLCSRTNRQINCHTVQLLPMTPQTGQ